MNVKIVSIYNLLHEIVEEIHSCSIIKWTKEIISKKIKTKFSSNLSYFIENWCYPDWKIVKNLENEVYELRIQISNWYLLRVIFYMKFDEIILSTWYLIKEESYDDKLSKSKIDSKYQKEINDSYKIFKDYSNEQKYDYIVLTDFIF